MSFNSLQLSQRQNRKENNHKIFNFKNKPQQYSSFKLHSSFNNQPSIFKPNSKPQIPLLLYFFMKTQNQTQKIKQQTPKPFSIIMINKMNSEISKSHLHINNHQYPTSKSLLQPQSNPSR